MRVNRAEDPVGLGIDQPEVMESSNTPDALGDRQNPVPMITKHQYIGCTHDGLSTE